MELKEDQGIIRKRGWMEVGGITMDDVLKRLEELKKET